MNIYNYIGVKNQKHCYSLLENLFNKYCNNYIIGLAPTIPFLCLALTIGYLNDNGKWEKELLCVIFGT